MDAMLKTAVRAAREAGELIRRAARDVSALAVRSKQVNDFVSEVDTAAERTILAILRADWPDHEVLAEESGLSGAAAGVDGWQWIVDPLDGTTNFLHGVPQYAVSIALRRGRALALAVVNDPLKGELFTATRGGGAFLNGQRISVSEPRELHQCLIGTGIPFRNQASLDQYVAMLRDLSHRTAGLRRIGAAALDLAYVACGRFDGFWELDLLPWDMAAGALLIAEAGGLVGDVDGGPDYLERCNLVAGNAVTFPALVELCRATRPARP
jgi:myo-inositol-1(or 4)-monophosphatase